MIVMTLVPNKQPATTRQWQQVLALMNLTENLSNFLSLLPVVRHSPKGRLQAFYGESKNVL